MTAESCPSLSDLREIPFTVKEEFRASSERYPPLGDHLAVELSELRQIQTSSGTTGRPMAMGLTAADAAATTEILRRGYLAVGFRSNDLLLHMFSMSRGWIGGLCMVEGYLALGATLLPIGAEAGRDQLLEIIRTFRPTGLAATPGFLAALGERARELGMETGNLGVKHMLTGGEPGGGIPSLRMQLTDMWQATLREVMGGTDVYTLVWAECPAERGMHFVAPDYVWFEIVDPDSGTPKPIEVGAVGEVVYTHLQRQASPILRFRHRDIIEVTGMGQCECGRVTPQIRCVGRADDMLIVRGVNLFPSAIRGVLTQLNGIGPEFRIVKPRGQYTLPGPVKLKVEAVTLPTISPLQLSTLLHQRLAVAFDVEFLPAGSLTSTGQHKARYFDEI
jgi:phenylacetate-CoA ligase